MIEKVSFEVYTETPTLEHYRHDWVPAAGVELGGLWAPAVVNAEDGQWYFGLRGWSDMIYGLTHSVSPVCGFRALEPSLDADPRHLYPEYAGIDWMEPYEVHEDEATSTLTYDSGQVQRTLEGSDWSDASGRWQVQATPISDIFVVHVPVQEGVDQEVYYRHQLMKATGTVEGNAVEGYYHLDIAYGPPGTTYTDLAVARDLYGMWVSWVHELADGTFGGGCFWQGRDGLDFGPGYLLRNGTTTAYDDITTTTELTEDGKPHRLDVNIGDQSYRMDLTMSGSPIHFFGTIGSSSSNEDIVSSWVWIEYPGGMINGEILDAVGEHYRLARRL